MPIWLVIGSSPMSFSRLAISPTCFFTSSLPFLITAMPAESYPLYSSFFSPSKITSLALPLPTYPTIPHLFFLLHEFFFYQLCQTAGHLIQHNLVVSFYHYPHERFGA